MPNSDILNFIQTENKNNQVVIWSKSYCPYCRQTKLLFQSLDNIQVKIHDLDLIKNGAAIQRILYQLTGQRTVPNVFVNNIHVGGNDKVQDAHRNGKLLKLLNAWQESQVGTLADEKKEEEGGEEENETMNNLRSLIEKENNNHDIVVWAKSWCPHCRASKELLSQLQQQGPFSQILKNSDIVVHDIDDLPNEDALQAELYRMTGQATVPNIFVKGQHLGGNSEFQKAYRSGELKRRLQ
ncbi:hypothetical protein ACA910_006638 [Epithemia clementina (nom. ined.)]